MSTQLGRRTVIAGALAAGAASRSQASPSIRPPPMPEADPSHAPFRAALLAWLEGASERCALPIAAASVSSTHTGLRIKGLHPALWFSLGHVSDINVGATWDNECWDLLTCPDVYAHEQPGGVWHNMLMRPECRLDHPSIEAAWRTDGFEPLLDWINDELAPATHLGLWRSDPSGGTWARLVRDGQAMVGGRPSKCRNTPVHLLPLHTHSPRPISVAQARAANCDAPIASAVQRGRHVHLYDESGRPLAAIPAGNADEDGLKGYTAGTVTIRRGASMHTYDTKGRQLSATPAR